MHQLLWHMCTHLIGLQVAAFVEKYGGKCGICAIVPQVRHFLPDMVLHGHQV